jgi:hypothetical protein
MHFSLSKLENLNIFRANLMLILQFNCIWTLFEVSCWIRLIDVFDYRWLLFLLVLPLLLFLPLPPGAVVNRLGMHNLKLFLETRLEHFLFFQLFLQWCDVVEGYKSITICIFLTGLSEMIVIFFPKGFLLLRLLQFLPSLFQIVDQQSALVY